MRTTLRVGRGRAGWARRLLADPAVPTRSGVSGSIFIGLCAAGSVAVLAAGWDRGSDGAEVVPLVALTAIALTVARWAPSRSAAPTRPLEQRLPLAIGMIASALAGSIFLRPELGGTLTGPIMTIALVGAYLALWGFRGLAVWRTVVLLSALTWQPVATAVHDVVRDSLEVPSGLIYQRLALVPGIGVIDEPWRVLSAELHRGSLVVIAAFVLTAASRRWRLDGAGLVELAATTTAAYVAHHTVILAMPIDAYSPDDATRLATDPLLELGIAVAAVVALHLLRPARSVVGEAPLTASDRDPIIFSASEAAGPTLTSALLTSCAVPVLALALVA